MSRNWRVFVAIGLLAAAPRTGFAQAVITGKDAETATIAKGRMGGAATVSNDVGLGTFVRNDYSDDPSFEQSLRVLPTYGLTKDISLQADETFYMLWTQPNDAERGPTGRRWTYTDLVFRISHASLYLNEPTDINLSGSFSASAPISYDSRWRNYITRLVATGVLSRVFMDRLVVNYILGASVYVPTSDVRGEEGVGVKCSPSGDADGCLLPGVNRLFSVRNEAGAMYQFTDRFSAGMLLRFTTYIKHSVGDPSEPENNPGRSNRYVETWTIGDISATYRFTDRYSASAGITSEQLVSDSRGTMRFPFFDFETASDNLTTFSVSGTATF